MTTPNFLNISSNFSILDYNIPDRIFNYSLSAVQLVDKARVDSLKEIGKGSSLALIPYVGAVACGILCTSAIADKSRYWCVSKLVLSGLVMTCALVEAESKELALSLALLSLILSSIRSRNSLYKEKLLMKKNHEEKLAKIEKEHEMTIKKMKSNSAEIENGHGMSSYDHIVDFLLHTFKGNEGQLQEAYGAYLKESNGVESRKSR